jgi:hypothetical protein
MPYFHKQKKIVNILFLHLHLLQYLMILNLHLLLLRLL